MLVSDGLRTSASFKESVSVTGIGCFSCLYSSDSPQAAKAAGSSYPAKRISPAGNAGFRSFLEKLKLF